MNHFKIVFILLLIHLANGYSQSYNSVSRVVDGDTFVISSGEKVRLIGVDTPECKHPHKGVEYFGPEASDFTKKQLVGRKVKLEFDVQRKDRYGRLLAYVYLEDGTFLNDLLVREGYAQVATYPPNVKYQEKFIASQRYAREKQKGLWGQSNPRDRGTKEGDESGPFPLVASTISTKYHTLDCRWAQKICKSNRIWFKSSEEAESNGFQVCMICKPR